MSRLPWQIRKHILSLTISLKKKGCFLKTKIGICYEFNYNRLPSSVYNRLSSDQHISLLYFFHPLIKSCLHIVFQQAKLVRGAVLLKCDRIPLNCGRQQWLTEASLIQTLNSPCPRCLRSRAACFRGSNQGFRNYLVSRAIKRNY